MHIVHKGSVVDPDYLNPHPDPALQVNQQKNLCSLMKIAIYLSLGLLKDVKATGKDLSPQKRTSSTSKI